MIAQKPLLERTSPLQITFLACAAGAAACLPFAPALVREAGDAPAGALAWTVYLGVVPTAIGFTTWAFALKRTSAGRLGATTYAVPPIAILLGWILLGETPPALALAGGLLCLAGVAVARGMRLRRRVARLPAARVTSGACPPRAASSLCSSPPPRSASPPAARASTGDAGKAVDDLQQKADELADKVADGKQSAQDAAKQIQQDADDLGGKARDQAVDALEKLKEKAPGRRQGRRPEGDRPAEVASRRRRRRSPRWRGSRASPPAAP